MRRTLKKPLEEYQRTPKCKGCGSIKFWTDKYRDKKENKNNCNCDAYWFPHRPGSSPFCIQHPTGPTEEDYKERYGGHYEDS